MHFDDRRGRDQKIPKLCAGRLISQNESPTQMSHPVGVVYGRSLRRRGVRGVKVDAGELVVGDDECAEVVEAAVLAVLGAIV